MDNPPLLHGKRFIFWHAQSHHLALSIEGVKVNMGNDPKRTCYRRDGKMGKLSIRKS